MNAEFCPSDIAALTAQPLAVEQCVCRCVHLEQREAPDPVSLGLVGIAVIAAYLIGQNHRLRRRMRAAL